MAKAARRVLLYLHGTRELGLRYAASSRPIYGMSDSDWTTRRSTSGFAFFLAGAAIAYLSKKQPTTAMSSTEAEIMAGSLAALEAVYLRMLLSIRAANRLDGANFGGPAVPGSCGRHQSKV